MSDPVMDVNSSNALLFSELFSEYQPGRDGSPFMLATSNGRIARPDDDQPWFFAEALGTSDSNHSIGELPLQGGMSTEILQHTLPQALKPQVLRPPKRSSTTSSTLAWSNATPVAQSVQPLAFDKPEVELPPRSGVRRGPLRVDVAEHARIMRKRRSCWPCRLVKFKVR